MTGDPVERLGLTPQSLSLAAGAQGSQPSSAQAVAGDLPTGSANYFIIAEDDPVLPDQVAAVPTLQSGEAPVVVAAAAPSSTETQARLAPAQASSEPQTTASTGPAVLTESQSAALEQRLGGDQPQQAAAVEEQARPQQILTNPSAQQVSDEQPAARTQKRGIFASLFARRPQADVGGGQRPAAADTAAAAQTAFAAASAGSGLASPAPAPRPAAQQEQEVRVRQPLVTLASTGPAAEQTRPRGLYSNDALPGVRQGALFEIKRRNGLNDDADIDLYEDEEVKVASAAGLARLAPNGLLKQTDNVDIACLKPSLVRVLKNIEAQYGKKLVVTSGYRSPPRNRAARGAKNSLHMYCAAADVQVEGVGKWQLAQFIRSMPGRGGVGTYCHTNSVHVDVGPERDWNWRCRRRK